MEQNKLTLGSLFDGSGGFPLGGLISGIVPLWASEIEPFPIRVTTKRLPFMKHYGDVSAIDGAKLPPVDIITFGSPCQDMSLAGKREGLDGNRSGLFYEAVRIVKEMRCATDGKYPRYIVWENVPGAFSSNKGEDFKAVLDEICRVKDSEADTPRPKKWPNAGCIMADDYSVAWRVFDAQYWGVPQRRKRIYLVADFTGGCAGKILFESEGLSGYTPQGFRSWQGTAGPSPEGSGEAGTVCLNDQTGGNNQPFVVETPKTLKIRSGCEGGGKGALIQDDKSATLGTHNDQTLFQPKVYGFGPKDSNIAVEEEIEPTMVVAKGPGAVAGPTYSSSRTSFFTEATEETASTLMATDYKDPPLINDKDEADYIVRRLTPTECARLQGFPDWWCDDLGTEKPTDEEMYFWYKVFETWRKATNPDGKPKTSKQIRKWLTDPYSDSAAYKLWGNGVALPCVHFVLAGIVYYSQFESGGKLIAEVTA